VTVFHGFEVLPGAGFNPAATASRLSGVHVSWAAENLGLRINPFAYWKKTRGDWARSLLTYGAGAFYKRASGSQYSGQFVLQRGRFAAVPSRGWAAAGRAEIAARAARVIGSYRFASGDESPRDGVTQTFDDLYSANYNSAGLLDPVVWRNLHDAGAGVSVPFRSRLQIIAEAHAYGLASREDGLYTDGGAASLSAIGALSSHVGDQVSAGLDVSVTGSTRIRGGFGRWFPQAWMRAAGRPEARNTFYVQLARKF
jgi:hypothetical protein